MLTRAPRGAAAHLELRNAWPVLFLTFSSMNNTEMLVEARNTGDSLHPAPISDKGANVICPTNNIFPSLEAIAHEELDGKGSEFSWSSIGSEPSKNDAPASAPETTYGTEAIEGDIPSHNTIAPTRSHSSEPSIPKHPLYFWDFISFKVEGTVFQLPKYRFVEDSDKFLSTLSAPGRDEIIELDVSLGDFESFLKAFIPRASAMYDDKPTLTTHEWISVLKLSTQWLFNDLRKLAISHLSSIKVDAIDRICLAKEYGVYDWLLRGYEQVVYRLLTFDPAAADGSPTTLTSQEGKRIGMDVALELSGIVIRRIRWKEGNAAWKDVKDDVLDAFKVEFGRVREGEKRFMTKSERMDEATRELDVSVKEKDARKEAEEKQKETGEARNKGQDLPLQEPKPKGKGKKKRSKIEDEGKNTGIGEEELQTKPPVQNECAASLESKTISHSSEEETVAENIKEHQTLEQDAKKEGLIPAEVEKLAEKIRSCEEVTKTAEMSQSERWRAPQSTGWKARLDTRRNREHMQSIWDVGESPQDGLVSRAPVEPSPPASGGWRPKRGRA